LKRRAIDHQGLVVARCASEKLDHCFRPQQRGSTGEVGGGCGQTVTEPSQQSQQGRMVGDSDGDAFKIA